MALLTIKQMQAELAISRACAYALIESGQLPCIRIGVGRGTIRVDESDLCEFIESRKQNATSKRRKAKPNHGATFVHLNAEKLRQAWTDQ